MSEEMIKNLISRLNHNCSNACLNDASSCICTVNDIKDLIHLYNKEKEKNKKIEDKIKVKLEKLKGQKGQYRLMLEQEYKGLLEE